MAVCLIYDVVSRDVFRDVSTAYWQSLPRASTMLCSDFTTPACHWRSSTLAVSMSYNSSNHWNPLTIFLQSLHRPHRAVPCPV